LNAVLATATLAEILTGSNMKKIKTQMSLLLAK